MKVVAWGGWCVLVILATFVPVHSVGWTIAFGVGAFAWLFIAGAVGVLHEKAKAKAIFGRPWVPRVR
jgi:hypothetical protein